jgi:hypothetical protein
MRKSISSDASFRINEYPAFWNKVFAIANSNGMATSPHEAVIVCDEEDFTYHTASYNFGLVFVFNTGGTSATNSFYSMTRNIPVEYFDARTNRYPVMFNATYYGGEYCSNLDNVPYEIRSRIYPNQRCERTRVPTDINGNSQLQTDWLRGTSGWSIPAPLVDVTTGKRSACGFEANPLDIYEWSKQISGDSKVFEIQAAAASMFSSWVYQYRYITNPGAFTDVGFRDIDWNSYTDCNIPQQPIFDGEIQSGKRRFDWMQARLNELFLLGYFN